MNNEIPNLPDGFKMTELGPLPEEWRVASFKEAILRTARAPEVKRCAYQPTGSIPVIDQSESFIAGYVDKVIPYTGDLPVIVFGDHTRVVKYVDFPFVAGADGTRILLPNRQLFEPLFLYYALFRAEIPSRGYNRHFGLLREQVLPLPPLPEQRAIAHALRIVQHAKEATKRVVSALHDLKKSLMRYLFTYGPVLLDRAESVPLRNTEIGPIPEHWQVVRLGEVAYIASGGSAPQGNVYFGGEHPFVRVQHLDEDGFFVQRWDLITDEAVRRYHLRLFPAGTIILPKSGASIRLEKRAILPVPAYLVSHLCAVIPVEKYLDRDFLFYTLKNIRLAAEKAEGYPTLTLAEIKHVIMSLPPLPEQREIARILQAVDRRIQAEESYACALEQLFKTLLHDLMTARRRVPRQMIEKFREGTP